MNIPDIVGFTLGDAMAKLEKERITVDKVVVTSPPRERSNEYDDSYRVIKVNTIDSQSVQILICKPL